MSWLDQRRACKTLYGWNNTGQQRKKLAPSASAACPICYCPEETQEHVFQCQAASAKVIRYNALVKLRSSVVTKSGGSQTWSVLGQCIEIWLEQNRNPTDRDVRGKLTLQLEECLRRAIAEQTAIGWKYAIRGILSRSWTQSQAIERGVTIAQARQLWLYQVLRAQWLFTHTMWTHRNDCLHKKSLASSKIKESAWDDKIRNLYEKQHRFACIDRRLFDVPLERRLQMSVRGKLYWVRLVEQYQRTTKARLVGKQYKITHFLRRKVHRRRDG
jgi:hypothetical protein